MDEIDKLIENDANLTAVEGEQQAWLLTGDQMKVARDALPEKPAEKPSSSSNGR